jgi:hypothetical protein
VIDDRLGELLQQHFASDQRLHTDADRRSRGNRGQCDPGPTTLLDFLHGRDEFVTFAMHRSDDQLLAAIVANGLADRLDSCRQR